MTIIAYDLILCHHQGELTGQNTFPLQTEKKLSNILQTKRNAKGISEFVSH
jgi:hypothetical protein